MCFLPERALRYSRFVVPPWSRRFFAQIEDQPCGQGLAVLSELKKEDPLVLRGGWTDEEVRRLARVASGEAERLLHRDPPVVANERELLSGQDLRPVERPDEGSAIHGDARGPRRRHAEEQRARQATWLKLDPLEPDLYLWIAGRRVPPGTGLVARNRDGAMRPLLLMAHG